MYLCIRGINFVYFYDSSVEFFNCSDILDIFLFYFIIGCVLLRTVLR